MELIILILSFLFLGNVFFIILIKFIYFILLEFLCVKYFIKLVCIFLKILYFKFICINIKLIVLVLN